MVFLVKVLMRHGVCLIGVLGIPLSLRRLVVFVDIILLILMHSILYLSMLIFGVTCEVLLTIILLHVLPMHTMLKLIIFSFSPGHEARGG